MRWLEGGGGKSHHVPAIVVESLGLERLFFTLEGFEFLCDVGVNEIGNVLAVHDLRDNVVLPLVVREDIILCTRKLVSWEGCEGHANALLRLMLYTPAPPSSSSISFSSLRRSGSFLSYFLRNLTASGINGSRTTSSRGFGWAT